MERAYAQALSRSLARGTDAAKLIDHFIGHLKEEGRMKMLPGILRELKSLEAKDAKLASTLEVASEEEKEGARTALRALGIEAETVTVNPDLIKGWRARGGSVLVDRSAKQALVDLYQKITN